MAGKDASLLSLLGHNFDEMLLSCTFRGMSCRNYTEWFWTTFWHYKYGNCFVFNSGEVDGVKVYPLKSNNPGPSQGLNLEINIDQDNYNGRLTPEAGIRVDISAQGEMPFPLERGVSLAPGYATMIGLRKIVKERKDPFNNKRCLDTVYRDENNFYTRLFNVSYSSTACKESCLAYNQLAKCGCIEYRFPAGQLYTDFICSVTDIAQVICIDEVQKLFKDNKLNCTKSCPPPCRMEEFKKSSSFAIWPSEKYEPFFEESISKKNKKFQFTKSGSHRKNVLKLQVFFEDFDVDVITEQRSYELVAFVSDIGGQLGLWIGFSVLTVAEFLELVMLLCHLAVKKCTTKRTSVRPFQE
ncbi:ligand-gated sodium channel [Desmophyllum pertusum]|uniref:Ligand-gated sodium channel n=1 Tax=Desmophyllum pertusum TaxID=174260 RepID=A0A9W9Z7B3_9CNID|nr:ligand-gated sodium channel [Desmophyllum pertusum]